MASEGTPDYQIGVALLLNVVKDQIMNYSKVSPPELPESPAIDEQNQKIVKELGKGIQVMGDRLDQDQQFINMINEFAQLHDQKSFSKVVESVFNDGQITWGRIIVLFYAVGKLSLKVLQANFPAVVTSIVNLSLDFFRTKLLVWIRDMGGWISSISAMAQLSLERISRSSFCPVPLSVELIVVFLSGIALGGLIVWKLNRSS